MIKEETVIKLTQRNGTYDNGTILLGVGISAAVIGAVFAGIGGYRFVKMKPASDDFDVSFGMSLNEASLQVRF